MLKGLVFSILSACCFGTLPILGKLGYGLGMETFDMLAYRYGFAALMLGAWLAAYRPGALRAAPRTLAKTAFLGLIVYPVQSTCFLSALKHIPASTTSLIFYLHPAAVALAAVPLFRQRMDRTVGLSLVLVGGGCSLVFLDAFMQRAEPQGVAFALGAMAMYTVYLLTAQAVLKNEPHLTVVFYTLVFTGLVFNVLAWPPAVDELTLSRAGVAAGLALAPTVVAVTLLYKAIECVGSSLVSIFSSLEPVATLCMAVALLGERAAPWQLAGAALIVGGIALPNLTLLRRRADLDAAA